MLCSFISRQIRKYKLSIPGKNTVLFKNKIRSDVEQVLLEQWDAVKVIAHALYQKKRLRFDEIRFLLTRRTINKDFWKDRFKKINLIYSNRSSATDSIIKQITNY